MSEVTRILNQICNGSLDSESDLLPAVYDELRQMAGAKIAKEKPGQTLDATALVHEAYLRLAGTQSFESRRHFFGAAAEAMRRILIDRARARNAKKRGDVARLEMDPDQFGRASTNHRKFDALNAALEKFAAIEPETAQLVKMRYFIGLKIREAAEVLGISTATADRHWAYARAWLQTEIEQQDAEETER